MAISDIPAAPVTTAVVADDTRSYVDWPAIFAGTLLASAIYWAFIAFGSAIGLSLTSAYEGEGMSLVWFAIAAGLWLLWVHVSAYFAGGYLAGRLRRRHGDATEYESDIRDGSHGLVVWAAAALLGAFIAVSSVAGAVSTATTALGAAGGAAAAVGADEIDPNAILVDRLLRGGPGNAEPVTEATRDEAGRILASSLLAGEMDAGDRAYLTSVVATRAGVDEAEAGQRVDAVMTQAREIEARARATADAARRYGTLAAFLTAAALFISAAAAYFGATLGGNHRDKQTVFADWYKAW